MKFHFSRQSLILIAAAAVFFAVAVFFWRQQPGGSGNLAAVEIKDYQGEKLSSVGDFRENSIKGPQNIDIGNYQMKISGLVKNPADYSYGEILSQFAARKKVVALDCVEGWSVKILWEGFLVRDLLRRAEVLPEAKTVIFRASDGYATSFPLGYFYDNDIIIAYKMNGIAIPPERGYPLMLVAESKWGYKWIKWITEIELSADEDYRGYWEKRGYSNSGDLSKPFLED